MQKKNTPDKNQLAMLFFMVMSGTLVLTSDQMNGIIQIFLSALTSSSGVLPGTASAMVDKDAPDIIAGYEALSNYLGYSVPTCVKMSKEGRFDAAVLDFGGTRKKIWDKKKLLEIARKKK